MPGQQQIQKPKPATPRESAPADAPTVNKRIARLWFRQEES